MNMRGAKNITLSLLMGVSVAFGIYAVRANYAKKEVVIQTPEGTTKMHLDRLKDVRLINPLTGERVGLERIPPKGHRLLIFLSAADCSACLGIIHAINGLHTRLSTDQLAIDALFVKSSAPEVREYLKEFPGLDSSQDLERKVGLPQRTPVAVVVDSRFDVELAEAATTSGDEHAKFVDQVIQLAQKEK